jgi:hypothetical protein
MKKSLAATIQKRKTRHMDEPKPLAGIITEEVEGVPIKKKKTGRPQKTPEGTFKAEIKAFFDHLGVFWSMPVQNGMGDRMVDFIGVWRSAAIAVEAKAPGKEATDKQADFLRDWKANGGWGFVSDSIDDLMAQWSEECLSCGIRPPAICSMTGTALKEALGFRVKKTSKARSSSSPTTSASKAPSTTSVRFTSAKLMCRPR